MGPTVWVFTGPGKEDGDLRHIQVNALPLPSADSKDEKTEGRERNGHAEGWLPGLRGKAQTAPALTAAPERRVMACRGLSFRPAPV